MDQTELLKLVFEQLFKQNSDASTAWNLLRQLQAELKKQDGIDVVYSLVNFLPNPVKRQSAKSVYCQSRLVESTCDKNRKSFGDQPLLALTDFDQEIWRISIRFPFIEKVDFEAARKTVLAATEHVSEKFATARKMAVDNVQVATETDSNADAPRLAQPPPSKVVYTGQDVFVSPWLPD